MSSFKDIFTNCIIYQWVIIIDFIKSTYNVTMAGGGKKGSKSDLSKTGDIKDTEVKDVSSSTVTVLKPFTK